MRRNSFERGNTILTVGLIIGGILILGTGVALFFMSEQRASNVGYYTLGNACLADNECVCVGREGVFDECGKPGQIPGCVEGRCGFKTP